VLSTDFDRHSDMEPKVHLELLSQAAARVPGPLQRFQARSVFHVRHPGRRSTPLGAASDVEGKSGLSSTASSHYSCMASQMNR
jgi:hypothetical protein